MGAKWLFVYFFLLFYSTSRQHWWCIIQAMSSLSLISLCSHSTKNVSNLWIVSAKSNENTFETFSIWNFDDFFFVCNEIKCEQVFNNPNIWQRCGYCVRSLIERKKINYLCHTAANKIKIWLRSICWLCPPWDQSFNEIFMNR